VSDQKPALSVANFVEERIKAAKGGKIAFRDVYLDYEAMAHRQDQPALAPDQFTASLAKLCEGTSVFAHKLRGTVFLINVRFTHQSARGGSKPTSLGPMGRSKRG
jgi:hypothetical protein